MCLMCVLNQITESHCVDGGKKILIKFLVFIILLSDVFSLNCFNVLLMLLKLHKVYTSPCTEFQLFNCPIILSCLLKINKVIHLVHTTHVIALLVTYGGQGRPTLQTAPT